MADVAPITEAPKPWVPKDSFATRLILIRRELDLTQAEAASRCGVKAATWNTWENGSRPRGLDAIVVAISKGLGVDRDWLMWGAESRATKSDKSRTRRSEHLTGLPRNAKPARSKFLGTPLLAAT